MDNTTKPKNIPIGIMYSPQFSCIAMSYYQAFLALDFAPYTGQNSVGFSDYCMKTRQSTTLNHGGAKFFYQITKSIIDGSGADKEVDTVLKCKRGAELIFEYKPADDGQMIAYLTIAKDNKAIPFWFPLHQYDDVNENGQKVTKVVQRGLGTFAKALEAYLIGYCDDNTIDRLPYNFDECQDYSKQVLAQQASLAAWNNVNN